MNKDFGITVIFAIVLAFILGCVIGIVCRLNEISQILLGG